MSWDEPSARRWVWQVFYVERVSDISIIHCMTVSVFFGWLFGGIWKSALTAWTFANTNQYLSYFYIKKFKASRFYFLRAPNWQRCGPMVSLRMATLTGITGISESGQTGQGKVQRTLTIPFWTSPDLRRWQYFIFVILPFVFCHLQFCFSLFFEVLFFCFFLLWLW